LDEGLHPYTRQTQTIISSVSSLGVSDGPRDFELAGAGHDGSIPSQLLNFEILILLLPSYNIKTAQQIPDLHIPILSQS
jgi:hypothetical protein